MMAGFAFAALPLAQAKIERVVEKSFTVSEVGTVTIQTSGGEIRVEPSADVSTVRVVATQRFSTNSEAEADKISNDLELVIEQSGNDVMARASREKRNEWTWRSLFNGNGGQQVRVDFKVIVPAAFAVVAKTSGGDLIVGDINGDVKVATSGGDVRLGRLGGTVEAKTSGGDIELRESAGKARLETSGGDIEAGRVGGSGHFSTSGGDIEIGRVEGVLRAHTSGGDVRAGFIGGLTGDSELSTSGGDVAATLDKSAAFELDARTSGGRVSDKGFAISEKERRKNRLAGAVNGGGPQLKLQSSGGDISVEAR